MEILSHYYIIIYQIILLKTTIKLKSIITIHYIQVLRFFEIGIYISDMGFSDKTMHFM